MVEGLLARAYEHAYEQGWTDSLPIIPATPRSVQQFVAASGRPADEVIGILPPRKGRATVEAIAVNAIMAGCRPEYMPVILAAVDGLLDASFPLEFMQVTTNMPPMYGGGDGALLLLGVNHAHSLHEAGLTMRDIQERLWKMARLPISYFAEGFAATDARRVGAMPKPCGAPAVPRRSTSQSPAAPAPRTSTSARACRRPASSAARSPPVHFLFPREALYW